MKSGKKLSPVLIVLIVILAVLVIAVVPLLWYSSNIGAKSNNDKVVIVEIAEGSTMSGVATKLKKEDIIKNELAFKVYAKLNHKNMVQAGTYGFSQNMDVKKIVDMLEKGEIYTGNQMSFTYIEGVPMWWLASKIEEQTANTAEDVYAKLQDEAYIDSLIEKYWFITDEIKNSNIYYPLEGYLFPDTYTFIDANISVEEIFSIMLNRMDEVLTEYKSQLENSDFTIHEFLSFVSVVESESMNPDDRAGIAGVFYNRLNSGMALGSDPTTYYAIKVNVRERALYQDELDLDNPYNTRGPNMEGEVPVGPICSISRGSIEASLNPTDFDALFFVGDKNGKTYFTNTNADHEKTIRDLKDQDLWFEW